MRHHDFAVIFDRVGDWKLAFGSLLAADNFPFQLFAGVQIDTFRIGHVAARANYVEVVFLASFANSVIVSNPESVRFRGLQLIKNLSILVTPFSERTLILWTDNDGHKKAQKTDKGRTKEGVR